ncbi:hypothetical protein COV19_00520 [Candidatus Woesearchaeota archaeon CG10_big_fil_rev_8_21_14_0_10_44_13]|nr:MAG: hypothetical protein COV19_00520 [Candidatus Woesearchaeota archaeon CG10_big_fil_rev_8_21_14_0_10_44_13]
MDTEKALKRIRKHLLVPEQSTLWWDDKKREDVRDLLEALDSLKDNRRITDRKFLKEKFDFLHSLFQMLIDYYDGKITRDGLLSSVDIKEIDDDRINGHLAKIMESITTNMVELALDITDFPDRESFCIPGCSVCCLTEKSGVIVYKEEFGKTEQGLKIFNGEFGENKQFDLEDIPQKWRKSGSRMRHKQPYAALPAFGRLPIHIGALKEEGFSIREKADHMCAFLIDRNKEQIPFNKWALLVNAYSAKLNDKGLGLDVKESDFPGYFQGLMCGIYPYRPYECAKKGCNYARKIMPDIIRRFGQKPVEEMLKEPTLVGRYRIANYYFKNKQHSS